MSFDDDTLHDAPFQGSNGILTACKGALYNISQGHIYLDHVDLASKLPEREVKKKFLMELSKLDPKNKRRCFDEIVSTLEEGGEGLKHIRNRLIEGVWNEIIEDTARNKNALITIETKRQIAMHNYSLSFHLPSPLRLIYPTIRQTTDEKLATLINK